MTQTILSAATAEGQLLLLEKGAFSDFKIICKNREFKAHRAILCPTSTYFSKVCANGFKFIVSMTLSNTKNTGLTVNRKVLTLQSG